MSAPNDRVSFKHNNGVISVMNKTIAETLTARKEGVQIRDTPGEVVDFVEPENKRK